MVHTFEIIPGRRSHCGQMARIMRFAHKEKYLQLGVSPHKRICECFEMSQYCKAWLIDGQLAALGGLEGPLVSTSGYVWLVISQRATLYPIAVFKTAKSYLKEIMKVKEELFTTIVKGDQVSLRLASHLGFFVDWSQRHDVKNLIPLRYSLEETVDGH